MRYRFAFLLLIATGLTLLTSPPHWHALRLVVGIGGTLLATLFWLRAVPDYYGFWLYVLNGADITTVHQAQRQVFYKRVMLAVGIAGVVGLLEVYGGATMSLFTVSRGMVVLYGGLITLTLATSTFTERRRLHESQMALSFEEAERRER